MSDFSLAIATPSHYGSFCADYVRSLFRLQDYCRDQNIEINLLLTAGISVLDYARNHLASQFLWQTECSHMLFIDDDMGFNVDDLTRMLEWRDYDVVGALYPKKALNWKRVKQAVLENPEIDPKVLPRLTGDYFEMFKTLEGVDVDVTTACQPVRVHVVATGLMMISRRCLTHLIEKAQLPKVTVASQDADASIHHPTYEFFKTSQINGKMSGEDYYFCSLVNRNGGAVYGCPWVAVTHVGKYPFIGDLPGIARYL
ncbi:MAG: hypothetical protein LBV61_00410 [Burkholderiaceae bacterium]|jgi:hypothetical protein|nr:hypothetical protein [Burkholderiaceae bacterium]